MLVFNERDALSQYIELMRFLIQNKDYPVTTQEASRRKFKDKDYPDVTREISQGTLEDHVVQVVCNDERGETKGTGFLVTEGGFLVTARHVIRNYEKEWRTICKQSPPPSDEDWISWLEPHAHQYFIEYQGQCFPLDISVWNDDPHHDVVVLKAVMRSPVITPEEARDPQFWLRKNHAVPFLHRGHLEGDQLPGNEEIEIYGMRTGVVSPQFGRITYTERMAKLGGQQVRDMFLTDVYIQAGYSGAPVLNSRGFCIGMASFSIPPGGKHPRGEEYQRGYAGCAPFSFIRRVLKSVADDLEEQTRAMRR